MIRIGGAMEADNVTYKEMKDLFFQDSFFLLSLFLTLQLTGMFIVVMLMANKKICSLWVDRRARTEIPVKNNIVWRLQCAAFQVILPYLIIDWIRVIFVWNQIVWVWLTRILAVSLMPRNSWSKYWYKYHIKEEESAFYFQLQGFDNRQKEEVDFAKVFSESSRHAYAFCLWSWTCKAIKHFVSMSNWVKYKLDFKTWMQNCHCLM